MSFLNYEPDILERVDTLHKSQDQRKKFFDEITQILVDRSKLEEFYSRSLERLCEGLQKVRVQGNQFMQQMVLSIITLFSSQAEQSAVFAKSVSTEMIPSLKEIFKEDEFQLKSMTKIGDRHERDLINQLQTFDKMRKQYLSVSQQFEKKVKDYRVMESSVLAAERQYAKVEDITIINQLKKKKQDILTEQKILECLSRSKTNSENELEQFVKKYNMYITEYFLDVARIEDEIQRQEIQKREGLKDSLMKYLVFKVSQIRNIQYDVDRITTKVTEINSNLSIKGYLTEILAANKTNSSTSRPLLSKLNFDNYKYFIDSTLLNPSGMSQPQSTQPPTDQRQRQKIFSPNMQPQNARNANIVSESTQNNTRNQRIFSENLSEKTTDTAYSNIPDLSLIQPDPFSNLPDAQIVIGGTVSQQQYQQLEGEGPFDPTKIEENNNNTNSDVPTPTHSEEGEESEQQKSNKKSLLNTQQPQNQINQNSNIATSDPFKSSGTYKEDITDIDGQRIILLKKESKHIKQPNDIKNIDIMELASQKLIQKQNNETEDSSSVPDADQHDQIVEIEMEDFFKYIMLKVWHNDEIKNYDFNQLKQILERDSTSREAFTKYFCSFFDEKIHQHIQQQISEEKDIANRLILERSKNDVTIEINSDSYTILMRLVYCMLDVLNACNDLHGISDIFRCSKVIFKVIRPPNELITAFERIFLCQGLSGHQLFSNTANWQDKLKQMIEQFEKDYQRTVIAFGSASDGMEKEQNPEQFTESQFLFKQISLTLEDLFEFDISKEQMTGIIKNLIDSSVIAQEVGLNLLEFVDSYEKRNVAVMQSEEISSEKAAIDNYQRNEAEGILQNQPILENQLSNQATKIDDKGIIDGQNLPPNDPNQEQSKEETINSESDEANMNHEDISQSYLEGLS